MRFSPYQLVLYPAQAATDAADTGNLRQCLQAIGLIGEQIGNGYYAAGEQFLSLLCFLGCSPDIELEPHPNKPFCYVQLPQSADAVSFTFKRKPAIHTAIWVVIGNIHEAEAVPDAALMDALAAASGQPWTYAYRLADFISGALG